MRLVSCVLACALCGVAATADDAKPAAWVTVKGRVVLPGGVAIPAKAPLNVTTDKEHCLKNGPILDETHLIDAKTRGIGNVVVWLRPDSTEPKAAFAPGQIHPADARRKPADVVIDQPCCMFAPRVTACRVGDTVVVKNPAPVAHNFLWTSGNNGEVNVVIEAGGQHRFANPLVGESAAIPYKCTIHPWMGGYARVFDHPYYAATDEQGNFEIKNAPAGKLRLVMWHEAVGLRGGWEGRLGEPVVIAAAGNGTAELEPIPFDVTAPVK